MTVRDIQNIIESAAPLGLQESYDNSGLQVGRENDEVKGILVCLDITEEVIDEASRKGCNLVVSHHPLLFKSLRCVSDRTPQQRCVCDAISKGIALYSAHTNLDNARGGVNFEIAERIGLKKLEWLLPIPGQDAGSGVVGELAESVEAEAFLQHLKAIFKVEALRCTDPKGKQVRKVALCGGAGSFLISEAQAKGVDCFITGEIHYHDYFDAQHLLLVSLGHYESEQYTVDLLVRMLERECPGVRVEATQLNTNPIVTL